MGLAASFLAETNTYNEMIMTNDHTLSLDSAKSSFFISKVTNMRLQRQCSVSDHNLINEECTFVICCKAHIIRIVRARLNSLAACHMALVPPFCLFSIAKLIKAKTKRNVLFNFAHDANERRKRRKKHRRRSVNYWLLANQSANHRNVKKTIARASATAQLIKSCVIENCVSASCVHHTPVALRFVLMCVCVHLV